MFWCMVFIDSKYYISIIMCIHIEDRLSLSLIILVVHLIKEKKKTLKICIIYIFILPVT